MAEIFINLLQSADAKGLEVSSLIHQNSFYHTVSLIERGVEKAIAGKEENEEHIHEAITVLGTRGSGKTTFLLSIREHFKNAKRIEILKSIDPTLIEEKGHIFLYIISIINDLVQDHFDDIVDNSSRRKDWNDLLFNLSHGLPSMDGVGGTLNEADWQDPEYIMEKGLRSVRSARNLAQSFQHLVSFALKTLSKDVFLLTFDDIDIDFKKGWNILETIRKYLHTSKIITLLSGDLKLYTLAIRKQYWNSFGKSILINEGDKLGKHSYFNDRITELESQYILKVIKPERRIHLTTLYEKLRASKSNSRESRDIFYVQINNQNVEIEELYRNILASFGIINKYQSDAYSSFLLGLPLRSQIQFLSQFELEYGNFKSVNVIDTFLSDLIEKNIDVNILDSNLQLLNVEILKLLLRENKLNELYQLQPVTGDSSLNSSLVALSLLLSIRINSNPYLIFDFFIKIGYVRNLLGILGYNTEAQQKVSNLSPSIEGLCNYTGVFQDKVLRDIAGNITSYLKGTVPNVNNWAGIISLPGLGDASKKGSDIVGNRIDRVFRNSTYSQRTLGFIPLSISAYSTVNRSIPCYSIFTLLATIGELIRKGELNDLSRGFAELSEVRTYGIPEFKKGTSERIESASFLSETGQYLEPSADQLFDTIEEWIKNYKRLDLKISPHLLGKISTRFYYALNSIESVEEETNLGEMMHRRVVALLNAILIEDVKENVSNIDDFNVNNTNLNDEIFVSNLHFVSEISPKVEFARWMISCPLLLAYLNPKSKLIDVMTSFLYRSKFQFNIHSENSVYSLLSRVATKGNRQNRQVRGGASSNYDRIIEILKEREIPFSWFQDSDDKSLVRSNNDLIRENLKDIFGENLTSATIRAFRNYIKRRKREW